MEQLSYLMHQQKDIRPTWLFNLDASFSDVTVSTTHSLEHFISWLTYSKNLVCMT